MRRYPRWSALIILESESDAPISEMERVVMLSAVVTNKIAEELFYNRTTSVPEAKKLTIGITLCYSMML